ncbi:hypothetical protein [Nostoc sp.]|uniref:hypothetical protein n=1 Tax=Nostoc sp. TaxID=1180 RepID=UPI002FF84D24
MRELADDGIYLIFPSQFTREYPDAPDPEGKTVFFKFEGAVLNIYATLAVRLSHSGLFIKKEMWRNAAIYSAKAGGSCGMFLRELEEGKGELTLFFTPEASEETRFYFEEYVSVHLQRRAISETIIRQSIFICDNCGFVVTHQLLKLRNEGNFNWVQCPGCEEQQISLLDHKERLRIARDSAIPQMDRAADARRNQETITSILQGKITTGDFDVLFCYNDNDSSTVTDIEIQVKEHGILPYMFSWEKQTDESSQNIIEDLILKRNSTMLFISNSKQRPWQNIKFSGLLRRIVAQGIPVITVILPDVKRKPTLPEYLKNLVIDFRRPEPDPMSQIIFGCSVVTGIGKDNIAVVSTVRT